MKSVKRVKVVFDDDGTSKILRGRLVNEDEFTYTIISSDNQEFIIGKRAVIKMTTLDEVVQNVNYGKDRF